MKKLFILLIAFMCSVQLIADNYRIASMNVPSVVIGGGKSVLLEVFSLTKMSLSGQKQMKKYG